MHLQHVRGLSARTLGCGTNLCTFMYFFCIEEDEDNPFNVSNFSCKSNMKILKLCRICMPHHCCFSSCALLLFSAPHFSDDDKQSKINYFLVPNSPIQKYFFLRSEPHAQKQAFCTQLWAVNEKCHPSARLLTDGNLVFWYSNHIRQNVNLEDNR